MKKTVKKYKTALFLFTRDYRLQDNTALMAGLKQAELVVPLFVFTHDQIDNNPYKSDNAVQFLVQSLEDVDTELRKNGSKLYMFHGDIIATLNALCRKISPQALFTNADYTPYARQREDSLAAWCKKNDIDFHLYEDALLFPVFSEGSIINKQGKPYIKFTPFFNAARKQKVPTPDTHRSTNYANVALPHTISFKQAHNFYTPNPNCAEEGGRKNALKILKNIDRFKNYEKTRDFFAIEGTTKLSAHLRFGTVSIREVFYAIRDAHISALARQLYWRDFYTMLVYHLPTLTKKGIFAFQPHWHTKHLQKILNVQTGVPLVDAGLMELFTTGWMHNRVRMVVASFMTKNLLIDWKEGEKLYGKYLVDHDRCVNLGNWHFMASTSAFGMMRSRLLNPYAQSKKFDKECVYIKKWLPALKNIPAHHIHEWEKYHTQYKDIYHAPIVLFADSKKYFLQSIKKK